MNRATSFTQRPQQTEIAQEGPQLVEKTSGNSHATILSSWKEIAAYLGKGVRTVQRWELELGLPVHRPVPGARRIVITTKEELAAWLVQQQTRAQAKHTPGPRIEFERMKGLVRDMMARAELLQRSAAKLMGELQAVRTQRELQLARASDLRLESQSLKNRFNRPKTEKQ